jgi:hypothetical protein
MTENIWVQTASLNRQEELMIRKGKTMKNCIQGNLIIAIVWANFIGWISRQSLAVTGPALFSKIEGQEFMKSEQDNLITAIVAKNPAGSSRKASQGEGWRGLMMKNSGVFEKIPKGVNLLYLPHRKSAAKPRCHWPARISENEGESVMTCIKHNITTIAEATNVILEIIEILVNKAKRVCFSGISIANEVEIKNRLWHGHSCASQSFGDYGILGIPGT